LDKPVLPIDEEERQTRLDSLEVLYTPAEERYDRITRIARRAFGVPIALISLIDRDRQWFKSALGFAATETPRAVSFCGHAILEDGPLVISDTTQDKRFADNPLVVEEPRIRFYAGQPLAAPDGQKVGTLCLIDTKPRSFTPQDRETLRDLAALVANELHVARLSRVQLELRAELASARAKASIDSLTRLWNRESILEISRREISRADRSGLSLAVVLVDIDNFKAVNDVYGHLAGDEVIRTVAQRMRSAVRPYDAVGRFGGEEFFILFSESDRETANSIAERVRVLIAEEPVETEAGNVRVTVSLGVATYDGDKTSDLQKLLASADQALYRAKRKGKNCVELEGHHNDAKRA
jgi:diguanylate cyclase (GGDEF)-like protein